MSLGDKVSTPIGSWRELGVPYLKTLCDAVPFGRTNLVPLPLPELMEYARRITQQTGIVLPVSEAREQLQELRCVLACYTPLLSAAHRLGDQYMTISGALESISLRGSEAAYHGIMEAINRELLAPGSSRDALTAAVEEADDVLKEAMRTAARLPRWGAQRYVYALDPEVKKEWEELMNAYHTALLLESAAPSYHL